MTTLSCFNKGVNYAIYSIFFDAIVRIVNADIFSGISNEGTFAGLSVLHKAELRIFPHRTPNAICYRIRLSNQCIHVVGIKTSVIYQNVAHLLLVTILPSAIVHFYLTIVIFHDSRFAVHVKQCFSLFSARGIDAAVGAVSGLVLGGLEGVNHSIECGKRVFCLL